MGVSTDFAYIYRTIDGPMRSEKTYSYIAFLCIILMMSLLVSCNNPAGNDNQDYDPITLTGDRNKLVWTDVADHYVLEIADDNAFTNPTIITVDDAVYEITYEGTHYCRVRVSAHTSEEEWSNVIHLTCTPWEIVGIDCVSIPGGSYLMGNVEGGDLIEHPTHQVTVAAFEMGVTEITQEQYLSITGTSPSFFCGECYPVQSVSWFDAARFCNQLSEKAGLTPCYDESTWECNYSVNGFRLPTEAEWEYACRAGTETAYYSGDDESDLDTVGWYKENSGETPHPVGQKAPNGYGLYDMHGNVWEWCNDWYVEDYYATSPTDNPIGPQSGTYKMERGGSWYNGAWGCRTTYRVKHLPSFAHDALGIRVIRRP